MVIDWEAMKFAAIVLTLAIASASSPRKWETAVLEETHRETKLLPNGLPDPQAFQFYTLDSGDRIVVCSSHVSALTGRRLDLEVGASVKFARSSESTLVLVDRKGKEHKLQIEQERQR